MHPHLTTHLAVGIELLSSKIRLTLGDNYFSGSLKTQSGIVTANTILMHFTLRNRLSLQRINCFFFPARVGPC